MPVASTPTTRRAPCGRRGGDADQRDHLLRRQAGDRRAPAHRPAGGDPHLGAQRRLALDDVPRDHLCDLLDDPRLAEHGVADRLVEDLGEARHVDALLAAGEVDGALDRRRPSPSPGRRGGCGSPSGRRSRRRGRARARPEARTPACRRCGAARRASGHASTPTISRARPLPGRISRLTARSGFARIRRWTSLPPTSSTATQRVAGAGVGPRARAAAGGGEAFAPTPAPGHLGGTYRPL